MPPPIEERLERVAIGSLRLEPVSSVSPSTSFGEVCRILDERPRGCVLVQEAERVVGIFTQRDVLCRTAEEGYGPETPIRELMTEAPDTVPSAGSLADALRVMNAGGYRQVPLVDAGGRAAGVVTSRDILRHVVSYYPEAVLNLPPRLHQTYRRAEGG